MDTNTKLQQPFRAQMISDKIFLSLPGAFQEKIPVKTKDAAGNTVVSDDTFIYLPQYDQEQHACVQGTIRAKGSRCRLDVEPGETVAISYEVTADYKLEANGHRKYHRAYLLDKEIVWAADNFMVFAAKRNGRWFGVGDWLVMNIMHKPNPQLDRLRALGLEGTELSNHPYTDRATFVSGTLKDAPGCQPGDTLFFDLNLVSPYLMPTGETLLFINRDYVDGYQKAEA